MAQIRTVGCRSCSLSEFLWDVQFYIYFIKSLMLLAISIIPLIYIYILNESKYHYKYCYCPSPLHDLLKTVNELQFC